MSKAKIISLSLGGVAIAVAVGSALFFWLSDREVRRVVAMQETLLTDDLSRSDSNALKTQLMRSIDEMDRETLRKLQDELRDQQRERMQASVTAYHAAIGEAKIAVLDGALDQLARAREVGFDALRTRRRGMPRGARQGARQGDRQGDRQRNPQANASRRDRADAGGGAGRPRGGEQVGRRGGDRQDRGDRDRQQFSEEQRELRGQYLKALRERAQERGMEWGRRRQRG